MQTNLMEGNRNTGARTPGNKLAMNKFILKLISYVPDQLSNKAKVAGEGGEDGTG